MAPSVAALPAAVVADALAAGRTRAIGVLTAPQVLTAEALLAEVEAAGFRVDSLCFRDPAAGGRIAAELEALSRRVRQFSPEAVR